jgi:hypothetical protein
MGTGGLDTSGYTHELFFAFHGTGSCHNCNVSIADFHTINIYDSIFRVKQLIGEFERMLDFEDSFYVLICFYLS